MNSIYNSIADLIEQKLPNQDIFHYYALYWRRWNDSSGRSNRAEFWWAMACSWLVAVILSVVLGVIGEHVSLTIAGAIGTAYSLLNLVPGITIWIRRLHDTNRSGWWILLALCCAPVLIIFAIMDSVEPNNYGISKTASQQSVQQPTTDNNDWDNNTAQESTNENVNDNEDIGGI